MKRGNTRRIATLGEFEILVLSAIIATGNDAYGVSVHEGVEELASRDISQGAVYTALMRLEDKGLISSKLGAPSPERGGKAKRFYTVEGAGQQALRSALRSMSRASRAIGIPQEAFGGLGDPQCT